MLIIPRRAAAEHRMSLPRTSTILIACIVAITVAMLAFAPLLENGWSLLTDGPLSDGPYYIPDESSVLTFRVTEMNSGSGEWWMYGEDYRFFYAQVDDGRTRYIAFPKSKVKECRSFRAADWTTWCRDAVVTHRAK